MLISFLISLFIWAFPTVPTAPIDITQTVGTSLRHGDASQLSARFSKTIELVIDPEKVDFSAVEANHAKLILRQFFRKYPPHNFQFVYNGASDKLRYSTGTYETDGQTFTVYVLMRQSSDRLFTINALHFKKE